MRKYNLAIAVVLTGMCGCSGVATTVSDSGATVNTEAVADASYGVNDFSGEKESPKELDMVGGSVQSDEDFLESVVGTETVETTERGKLFSDDFNSYYEVNDGKAVATVAGEGSIESTESDSESAKETDTENQSEIIFYDKPIKDNSEAPDSTESSVGGDTTDDAGYTEKSGSYSAVSNFVRTVSSSEPDIVFTNDRKLTVRYAFSEGDTVIYDTGDLNPGESAVWEAYKSLEKGYHEYEYYYEQRDGGITSLSYTTTACITVKE